jgi:hypothetical protein
VKVKDKPTADALIAWYAEVVKGLVPLIGQQADNSGWQVIEAAGQALVRVAPPDSPEPLAAWLAAFQVNETYADNMVPMEQAFRFVRANQALIEACAEGVTCETQRQAHG